MIIEIPQSFINILPAFPTIFGFIMFFVVGLYVIREYKIDTETKIFTAFLFGMATLFLVLSLSILNIIQWRIVN